MSKYEVGEKVWIASIINQYDPQLLKITSKYEFSNAVHYFFNKNGVNPIEEDALFKTKNEALDAIIEYMRSLKDE